MINLEVYLNAKVSIATTVGEGYKAITENKFDLIIALEKIDNEEAGLSIQNFLMYAKKEYYLLISSAFSNETLSPNVFTISGKYDIKKLLKFCANLLGVTAKQMASHNVGATYPISLDPLQLLKIAPCDIYSTSNGKEILFKENESLEKLAENVLKFKMKKAYVNSGDRLVIINNISLMLVENILSLVNNVENQSIENQISAISDAHEFVVLNIFSTEEIAKNIQEIGTSSAKIMANVAKETASLSSLLAIMKNNQNGYIFTHSIFISYVAIHLLREMTWGAEGQLEKINFVLFFHDIFLAPIYLKYPDLKYESLLLDDPRLTDKEKDIVINHARLAAEVVVDYKRCPLGADQLIKQHHGMKKGKGFATVFPEDMSPIAKIIIIAERFIEEFLIAQDNKVEFSVPVALTLLRIEFKSKSFEKIVNSLSNLPI